MQQSLNVMDFASVEEAINACPYGGKLYFPGDEAMGPYRPPTKDGWVINKPIELYGDSRVNEGVGLGYYIDPVRGTADSTILTLKTGANHVYIHDLCLSAPSPWPIQKGSGCGIKFDEPGAVIWGTCLERVGILYAGRSGIYAAPLDTSSSVGYFVSPRITNSSVYGCMGHGMELRNATNVSFRGSTFTQNRLSGIYADNLGGSLDAIASEGNGYDLTDVNTQASLVIKNSAALSMRGIHFEDFGHSVVKTAVILDNCRGLDISGNLFEAPGERGLFLQNCKSVSIGSNAHFGLKTAIELDAQCSAITILPQNHESWGADQFGKIIVPVGSKNVTIPMVNYNDNRSAGINFPEVNGTSEVKNPRNGLVIYDKNAGRLKYYHSGSWRTVRIS